MGNLTPDQVREKVFNNFVEEAENFFVNKFVSTPTIKKTYTDCLDILYNFSKTMDHARGLMAVNPKYGQGKSFFFEVVNHRQRRRKGKNLFVKTSAKELCHIYTSASKGQDPQKELDKFIDCKNLFIDDIGEELKDGRERSHYSNKLNVLRYVILKRYELWVNKGWKLHGTTNLTFKQIQENYDGRCADRLKQMVHWVEFDFLKNGTFRQMEDTRILTREEIAKNWEKFKPTPKVEKIDLEKYFNDMVKEPDEYFEDRDVSFWSFTKEYLIKKGFLNDQDFDGIDEQDLISSELLLNHSVRQHKKSEMKHAKPSLRRNAINDAIKQLTKRDIYNAAENIIAKKKFLELRSQKHVFV